MLDAKVNFLDSNYYCNGSNDFKTFKNYIRSTELTEHLRPSNKPVYILKSDVANILNVSEATESNISNKISFIKCASKSQWKEKLKNKTKRIVSNSSLLNSIHSFIDTCGLYDKRNKRKVLVDTNLHQTDMSTGESSKQTDYLEKYDSHCNNSFRVYVIGKHQKRKKEDLHLQISDQRTEIPPPLNFSGMSLAPIGSFTSRAASYESIYQTPNYYAVPPNQLENSTVTRSQTPSSATIKSISKRPSNESFLDIDKYSKIQQDTSTSSPRPLRFSNMSTQIPCPGPCTELTQLYKQPPSLRRRSLEDDIHQYWTRRHSKTKQSTLESSGRRQSRQSETSSFMGDSTGCMKADMEDGKKICVKYKRESYLSNKNFSPIEITPCSTSCNQTVGINTETFKRRHKKSRDSSEHDPMMLFKGSCKCVTHSKQKPLIFKKDIVQPAVGYCAITNKPESVQYALVKISAFSDYKTYEILKPFKRAPKDIPTCIAEIFVISRRNGVLSMKHTLNNKQGKSFQ